jgi:CRISPR/Cas system endoribonuclease Cas6 (RAMP superfamily)
MPLEADNNLEESWEMPELVSLTSDYIIEQISFSKDSTRFAVSTGKNLHIFRYNESKRTFADEEKHSINIPFNFCWNFVSFTSHLYF